MPHYRLVGALCVLLNSSAAIGALSRRPADEPLTIAAFENGTFSAVVPAAFRATPESAALLTGAVERAHAALNPPTPDESDEERYHANLDRIEREAPAQRTAAVAALLEVNRAAPDTDAGLTAALLAALCSAHGPPAAYAAAGRILDAIEMSGGDRWQVRAVPLVRADLALSIVHHADDSRPKMAAVAALESLASGPEVALDPADPCAAAFRRLLWQRGPEPTDVNLRAVALLVQARCWASIAMQLEFERYQPTPARAKGATDRAARLCQQLIREYPDSTWARKSSDMLRTFDIRARQAASPTD